MKIVLATGIYPPDIGGPATYVQELALQLTERGEEVRVITYGEMQNEKCKMQNDGGRIPNFQFPISNDSSKVLYVSKRGGPLFRWLRYARMLRKIGRDADVVIAFSSVSAGVPVWMNRLKKPKKILRLGGDFLWERYTDKGGNKGLREFYALPHKWIMDNGQWIMQRLLLSFDHIIFSTRWQEELYESCYATLPAHSVIENALPEGVPVVHQAHDPFRLLFFGRFVAFKNLVSLLDALASLPDATLTLAGSGPMEAALRARVQALALQDRVTFLPPQAGADKRRMVAEHDLFVLPSITDISPNAALEARAAGMPVLLTAETGLSADLTRGMLVRPLRTAGEIAAAVRDARDHYADWAAAAARPALQRGWKIVAQDWRDLLSSLA